MATQVQRQTDRAITSTRKRKATFDESSPAGLPRADTVSFGRETCGSLEQAEQREWLVTNGIGGFASGTISGNLTRRYHGLLFAALNPPMGRTQMVAKLDEVASYDDADYPLATNRWTSGAVEPKGFLNIESFRLEGTTPVWQFATGDALLEKRIWMQQGENTTFVQYSLVRANSPLQLACKALVNYRDYHATTHAGNWQMHVENIEHGIKVTAFDGAAPFYLFSRDASVEPRHEWHRDCFLPLEQYRGLDTSEDHLLAGIFHLDLRPGQSATIVLSTIPNAELDGTKSLAECDKLADSILANWDEANKRLASSTPGWIQQLVLNANQFIVKRALPSDPDARSIIAGYHWFGDWGRDTMIALPGLLITTGRPDIARAVLLAFARYADGGMLPNNFPDAGGTPEYNTVDAALWFFEAVRQYFVATRDTQTIAKLFPALSEIIDAHLKGTRYQIHADESDGLLYAGEEGVQLTWMDARVGNKVITPRIGKPVEINALWYNALRTMAALAPFADKPAEPFRRLAHRVQASFSKFWDETREHCYDVIDAPGIGNDTSLRPNQIFAVSLPDSALSASQQKSVVDTCARRLLTSHGLRSLRMGASGYEGHYGGSPQHRDGIYHQGTVWGWLMGPFVLAHLRVYNNPEMARSFLEPIGKQITTAGLGTLSEIFDGDAPFNPRGCIAQAWTVAEVLRSWRATFG
jgi:predicted glycogen debranching enzyme